MKISNLFDIKTKSDLKEYFVLTSILGVGMFLTISLFSISFYYQIKSHQKHLDMRSLRIQEHVQQTLHQQNLGLKYLERQIRYDFKSTREPLLPTVDGFLHDSYFEAIDIVSIDWGKDHENPVLALVNSDARHKDEKGLIFENFLRKIDQYKIPLYNAGKSHSFIFSPGAGKNWYVAQIRYIEGRKSALILGWIPIEKLFMPVLYEDQPLSITFSNFFYPNMPSVRAEYDKGHYVLKRVEADDRLNRRSFSFASHQLAGEDGTKSNIQLNYIYANGEEYGWSWIVLVAGLSISILVSLLFFNLINRNIEVHRLVEEKTQDVIRASREAVKASEVKTRFLANMSHEVRTPLNIILGMAELLAETKLSVDQKKYVDTFRRSGVHLLDLINDVIDMIRLEGDEGVFEQKDFSIGEVVQEVSSFCAVNAQSKSIDFSYFIDPEVPALVCGDQRRLKQILLNLINNSIKFTDAGFVKLSVLAGVHRDGKRELKFTVEDSGIGISETDQKKIFNAFTQLDPSSTRNKGGVGLGLSIVKTILNKIGGGIEISSKVELGSRFIVTVPYEVVDERGWMVEISEPFGEAFRGKCVSVLATESFELKMITNLFQAMNCPVNFYSSEYRFTKEFKKTPSFNDIYIIDYEAIHKNKHSFLSEVAKIAHPRIAILFLLPVIHQKEDFEELQKIPNIKIGYKPLSFHNLCATLTNNQLTLAGGADTGTSLGKDAKILIVEDDLENRQLMQAYLTNINCEIEYAASGNEGLQLYKKMHPHLIITDIQMPEMDGFKLTSLIRQYEKEYGIREATIFALSADALPEHKATAQEVGVNKYLTKPISKIQFIQSLAEAERLYKSRASQTTATLSQAAH